ncbi:MAG TPA: cell division protein FtsB [Xanthomonadaceae bacterium]|nr:cell division protein FtsB [Xanthomonadaceae bacterium]
MGRYLVLGLLVLLLLLQLRLWVGAGGMREVWRLESAVESQQQENEEHRQRNEALAAEVHDLREGEEAVEERARSELGMIKPGEVFYHVVDEAPPPREEERRRP